MTPVCDPTDGLVYISGMSLRFARVDGCYHELHAPHRRRGAVPLGELSPRFESTESARVQHLEGFALDQGPEDFEDPGTHKPFCL